jgi:hypothetical protein
MIAKAAWDLGVGFLLSLAFEMETGMASISALRGFKMSWNSADSVESEFYNSTRSEFFNAPPCSIMTWYYAKLLYLLGVTAMAMYSSDLSCTRNTLDHREAHALEGLPMFLILLTLRTHVRHGKPHQTWCLCSHHRESHEDDKA